MFLSSRGRIDTFAYSGKPASETPRESETVTGFIYLEVPNDPRFLWGGSPPYITPVHWRNCVKRPCGARTIQFSFWYLFVIFCCVIGRQWGRTCGLIIFVYWAGRGCFHRPAFIILISQMFKFNRWGTIHCIAVFRSHVIWPHLASQIDVPRSPPKQHTVELDKTFCNRVAWKALHNHGQSPESGVYHYIQTISMGHWGLSWLEQRLDAPQTGAFL